MPDYWIFYEAPQHGIAGDGIVNTVAPLAATHVSPIRIALADHLSRRYEIVCTPDQVTVRGVHLLMKGDDTTVTFKGNPNA